MMRALLSLYAPSYPAALVYMLQSTEYRARPYLRWYWRTNNFSGVMRRRTLERTRPARLLLLALRAGMLLQILVGILLMISGLQAGKDGWLEFGAALLLSYPIVWAHLVILPLALGRILIINPREHRLVADSQTIFSNHPATIIAVAGSYGKTSMKELLATVLGEGKRVAVTPANKNVSTSHAAFAASLTGDEEVLVIEYGEGKPGDVARFARTTQPDIGIITGIAPAHLDQYPTLDAAARDIFALADYLADKQMYVNAESSAAKQYMKAGHHAYSGQGIDDWTVVNVQVDFTGVRFTLKQGKQKLALQSGLLGRHTIGPLALAAVLGLHLGLTKAEIEAGIAKTVPFEHRMQPRMLGGAWIIDDTYNGNIDGIRAGLRLLAELPAKRKIYVTPGLVDQGAETVRVHEEIGRLIAAAQPDMVVLMRNSAAPVIQAGLETAGFTGQVRVEEDPLAFYTNLESFLAAGDLVLMQNDWTDNYH